MKNKIMKIAMVIVICLFSVVHAGAFCSPPVQGSIIYGPAITPPAEINYQTGAGYCMPSENIGGVVFDINKCDKRDELVQGNDYILMLKIKTEGFDYLLCPVDATNTTIAVKAYESIHDLCNDEDAIEIELDATCNKNRILSNSTDTLILDSHPYLLINIPSMVYDKNIVDGSDLIVSIGIIDAGSICIACESAICAKEYNLGKMSCYGSLVFPYGIYSDSQWWTGIVVSNLSDHVGIAKFTIVANGEKFDSLQSIEGNSVLAITVDQLLGNHELDGNRCYVIVHSNFEMDGICIYGNPDGHSAYIARKIK